MERVVVQRHEPSLTLSQVLGDLVLFEDAFELRGVFLRGFDLRLLVVANRGDPLHLRFVPTAIKMPESDLDKMRNLILNDLYPEQLYQAFRAECTIHS